MPVEEQLITGEEILARAGDFYATNKRILRYRKRLVGEELDDLVYSHITSITYVRKADPFFTTTGIMLVIAGIVGIVVNIFTGIGLVSILSYAGVGLGILLVLYGILFPETYMQFRAAGVSDDAGVRLRMTNVRPQDAKKFISLVREHM